MKDLYSFCKDEAEHNAFYEQAKLAYKKVFDRVGIGHLTYLTFASGGSFSKFSHEFQTLTPTGEDTIYVDEAKRIAINQEVYTDEVIQSLGLSKDSLVEKTAVEVGNIFTLSTRFSDALGLNYQTEHGETKPVFMGSYGIGPTRLMGTVVEALADDKGIIWPETIAPFKVHLLTLGNDQSILKRGNELYQLLTKAGVEVLFDDRDESAGVKFNDSDLIGIPYRVLISAKTGDKVELKKRGTSETSLVSVDDLLNTISVQ